MTSTLYNQEKQIFVCTGVDKTDLNSYIAQITHLYLLHRHQESSHTSLPLSKLSKINIILNEDATLSVNTVYILLSRAFCKALQGQIFKKKKKLIIVSHIINLVWKVTVLIY